MRKSSVYSLSMISAVVVLSMGIMPYLFHDFKLTMYRSAYVEETNRNLSTIEYDLKIIEQLGLADLFSKIDRAYESTKGCTDTSSYLIDACQVEIRIKAYKAYNIIEQLGFDSIGNRYGVIVEDGGNLYKLFLESDFLNWIQYIALGSILSIIAVLVSAWLVARYERSISSMQNHAFGILLGIFVASLVILVLAPTEMFIGIMVPSPYSFILVGVPFMTTYASWYYLIGKKLIRGRISEQKPEK